MEFLNFWLIVYLCSGAITGVLAGLLGIGGGVVLVPMLSYLLLAQGFAVSEVYHVVLATAMACIVPTAIASMWNHQQHGHIRWDLVKRLAPGLIMGAFITAKFLSWLDQQVLIIVFILVIGFLVNQMLFDRQPKLIRPLPKRYKLSLAGSVVGCVASLVSISGGTLIVPYLVGHGVNLREAISSAAAIGVPVSLFASLGHVLNGVNADLNQQGLVGYIYVPAWLCICFTSILTTGLGVKLSQRLPVLILKKIFGLFLLSVALSMLLRFY